jgi:hypothetical protein
LEEMVRVKMLDFGVPSGTVGVPARPRVFTRSVAERAIDDVNESDGRLLVTTGGGNRLVDVCGHVVNVEFTNESMYFDIEFLETEAGKTMAALVGVIGEASRTMGFSLSGTCVDDGTGKVTSMIVNGVDLVFRGQG